MQPLRYLFFIYILLVVPLLAKFPYTFGVVKGVSIVLQNADKVRDKNS